MALRVKLILNPIPWDHRAWTRLPEIMNILEEAGIKAEVVFTKITEALNESVTHAARGGYDLVIAGGGDGTVSEVGAGLIGTGVPLGILPVGTYNNIAHNLGLSLELTEAARVIARGKTLDIDVGIANGTYFFEAVGVGLDATLFPVGEDIKEGHYEKLWEAALIFLGNEQADIELILPERKVKLRSPMVVVANGPYYGAGFTIAPGASMTDGLLEVISFRCNKMELARHFALSAQNREHEEPGADRIQAKEITIQSPLPFPAHADGKPIGFCPVTCRMAAHSLRVIVP